MNRRTMAFLSGLLLVGASSIAGARTSHRSADSCEQDTCKFLTRCEDATGSNTGCDMVSGDNRCKTYECGGSLPTP
jgi:hypothetical protein